MDERPRSRYRPTRQLRRRKVVNRAMELLMVTAAALAVGALVLVILAVVSRGYKAISWDFFTQPPSTGFFETAADRERHRRHDRDRRLRDGVRAAASGPVAIYTHEFARRGSGASSASRSTCSTACRRS